jgi:hypothetical protein
MPYEARACTCASEAIPLTTNLPTYRPSDLEGVKVIFGSRRDGLGAWDAGPWSISDWVGDAS